VHGFHQELTAAYGWAPPVAGVIPYLPEIGHAQDEQTPPVTRVEPLAKEIGKLADALFPGGFSGSNNGRGGKHQPTKLRLPRLRFV
jgi:hypothetical protein